MIVETYRKQVWRYWVKWLVLSNFRYWLLGVFFLIWVSPSLLANAGPVISGIDKYLVEETHQIITYLSIIALSASWYDSALFRPSGLPIVMLLLLLLGINYFYTETHK